MKASNDSEPARTTISPPVCPACQSASVTTAAKHPDVDSYWRCQRCGEIWNINRRHDRMNGRFPWR
jgi:transposase-like protein